MKKRKGKNEVAKIREQGSKEKEIGAKRRKEKDWKRKRRKI